VRIVFGTDERTTLTDAVQHQLAERGDQVVLVAAGDAWPDVGQGDAGRLPHHRPRTGRGRPDRQARL